MEIPSSSDKINATAAPTLIHVAVAKFALTSCISSLFFSRVFKGTSWTNLKHFFIEDFRTEIFVIQLLRKAWCRVKCRGLLDLYTNKQTKLGASEGVLSLMKVFSSLIKIQK